MYGKAYFQYKKYLTLQNSALRANTPVSYDCVEDWGKVWVLSTEIILRVLEIQQFLGFFRFLSYLEHSNEQFAHDCLLDPRKRFCIKRSQKRSLIKILTCKPFYQDTELTVSSEGTAIGWSQRQASSPCIAWRISPGVSLSSRSFPAGQYFVSRVNNLPHNWQ